MSDKGALERLEKKLEARGGGSDNVRRSRLFVRGEGAPDAWHVEGAPLRKGMRIQPSELLFAISLIFFIVAGGVAALLVVSGTNTVSAKNVSIAVDGPTQIRAGDTLPLQVAITNRNSVAMELTDLIVEFPPGTRSGADITVALPRMREALGTIEPGESVNRSVRATVFGAQGSTIEVRVSVEYRVASSNAVFVKDATFAIPISESPAAITVSALSEVVSGQETVITVNVSSNVTDVLSDMVLTADYPPGFSFISASPTPLPGNAAWRLGDIERSGKRTITIRGMFVGEDGDQKVTHFNAGTEGTHAGEIAAPLASGDFDVVVKRPFVSAVLALNGATSDQHVVMRGAEVRGDIRWSNNLPGRVQDVQIEVKLSGTILDRTSVLVQQGFYRSFDNTIIFSKETNPLLADVAPGDSGVATFSFSSLPTASGTFKNPEIRLAATVHARRITEANVPEAIDSSAASRVLVASDLVLAPSLSRTGPFANTGSLPPQADHETTYTVTWTVSNTTNAVANAVVTASLPSYVRFTGVTSPDEDITFSTVGGVVTWDIGDMSESAARTASFQIGFTPSVLQAKSSPTLVSEQKVQGFDRFTQTRIERSAVPLTTLSGFSEQQGRVVP